MKSEFEYRLTRKAETDLEEIVSCIADELSNPKAASDFLDRLQIAIAEIRLFPECGPIVENEYLPTTDVRKILVESYILYYLPDCDAKMITILRIIYSRRDMDDIMKHLF